MISRGDGPARGSGRAVGRDGRPPARLWVLRDGKLVAVRVRTGLDDGTLVEVAGDDLHVGDLVVVNAVRPVHRRPPATNNNRPPGTNHQPRGGGGFRL